jgi:hypothetical protein
VKGAIPGERMVVVGVDQCAVDVENCSEALSYHDDIEP